MLPQIQLAKYYVVRKVGIVQRLCNCANVPLGGGGLHTDRGEVRKEDFKFLCESSLQCLCYGKIWIVAKYIMEKLAMVKDFVIVQIVNLFLGNTLTARRNMDMRNMDIRC